MTQFYTLMFEDIIKLQLIFDKSINLIKLIDEEEKLFQ